MNVKTKKKPEESKYTKLQRNTLIACAIIMVTYVVLAYFIAHGSFWIFATVHVVLAAIAILFIWLGNTSRILTYIVLLLSLTGAGTALALILYYLTILSNLANG